MAGNGATVIIIPPRSDSPSTETGPDRSLELKVIDGEALLYSGRDSVRVQFSKDGVLPTKLTQSYWFGGKASKKMVGKHYQLRDEVYAGADPELAMIVVEPRSGESGLSFGLIQFRLDDGESSLAWMLTQDELNRALKEFTGKG